MTYLSIKDSSPAGDDCRTGTSFSRPTYTRYIHRKKKSTALTSSKPVSPTDTRLAAPLNYCLHHIYNSKCYMNPASTYKQPDRNFCAPYIELKCRMNPASTYRQSDRLPWRTLSRKIRPQSKKTKQLLPAHHQACFCVAEDPSGKIGCPAPSGWCLHESSSAGRNIAAGA